MADVEAFAFAGIWQYRKGTVGDTDIDGVFYSMVTTSPNEVAAKYHNRMPVVLASDAYETWLNGEPAEAATLMQPFTGALEAFAHGEGLMKEPLP